jgi:hypothetical protein
MIVAVYQLKRTQPLAELVRIVRDTFGHRAGQEPAVPSGLEFDTAIPGNRRRVIGR